MAEIALIIAWLLLMMVYPVAVAFTVEHIGRTGDRLQRRRLWEGGISRIRLRVAVLYHELAHALLGLPFGIIPHKIVVWDEAAEYVPGVAIGSVRQLPVMFRPLFWVPLIGDYFSGLGPVLLSMGLGIALSHWLFHPEVSWWVSGIPPMGWTVSGVMGMIFDAAIQSIFGLLDAYKANLLTAAIVAILFGVVLHGVRPSGPDLRIAATGVVSILVVVSVLLGILLFARDGAPFMTEPLVFFGYSLVLATILINLTVLSIVSSFICLAAIVVYFMVTTVIAIPFRLGATPRA